MSYSQLYFNQNQDIGEALGVSTEEISRIVENHPQSSESQPSKVNSLPSMEMHAFLVAFELSFGLFELCYFFPSINSITSDYIIHIN